MKLFVDDIRNAPDDTWTVARTIGAAIRAMHHWTPSVVSLDHDISHQVHLDELSRPFPCAETFASVAYYIAAKDLGPRSPKITIHSSNTVAGDEMRRVLLAGGYIADLRPVGIANRLEMVV